MGKPPISYRVVGTIEAGRLHSGRLSEQQAWDQFDQWRERPDVVTLEIQRIQILARFASLPPLETEGP